MWPVAVIVFSPAISEMKLRVNYAGHQSKIQCNNFGLILTLSSANLQAMNLCESVIQSTMTTEESNGIGLGAPHACATLPRMRSYRH